MKDKKNKSSIVSMTKSTFKKEHKTLIRILKTGSKKERVKEAGEQARELKQY